MTKLQGNWILQTRKGLSWPLMRQSSGWIETSRLNWMSLRTSRRSWRDCVIQLLQKLYQGAGGAGDMLMGGGTPGGGSGSAGSGGAGTKVGEFD
ncbi:hypothetical protein Ancab_038205 [Ancistrocladus abbreviatus]